MEFYPHQKQQQNQQPHTTTQQVNDGAISGPATNTNTINSNNNNNGNIVQSTNTTPPTSNIIHSTTTAAGITTTRTTASIVVDAATVAIAKDMLQLHHGTGAVLNNSNNSNNSNNNSSNSANSNTNNNNNSTAVLEAMNTTTTATSTNNNTNNSVVVAGSNNNNATNIPVALVAPTTTTTLNTNHPPAHASANTTSAATIANANTSGGNTPSVLTTPPDNALGFLKYDQELLYITESCTVIGRNSSTSHVHFHVAENNLVSRKHFQVLYDGDARDFFVQCLSKNGIFVDDFLQRRNADPLRLPVSCYFRFPSTEIRIQFESFVHSDALNARAHNSSTSSGISSITYHNNSHHHNVTGVQNNSGIHGGGGLATSAHVAIISPTPPDDHHTHHNTHAASGSTASAHASAHGSHHHHQHHVSSNAVSSSTHLLPHMDNSNVYSPLKISIPKKEQKSPYLSPTGTISAANSCPASPRQSFHQNQATYNNYSNNNIQNQDLFQTPSTVSYNHNEKPPYSYAQLIVQAISAAPDKQLTLSGIYSFIVKHYPYYRKETNKGWQNSIRHNLSLNRYFIKVARSQDEPGKGSFWRIDPDSGAKLIDHSYKKRRQRSSQGFRPSYGMPRSAPVSPSHMDNSRESSPLQDFVLQSAPGSPGMSIEQRAADGDLTYNNTTQHVHQSTANNSHNQYKSSGSPYYVSNQNSAMSGGQHHQQHNESGIISNNNSSGNGVGALIALKRNHVLAAGAQQHQQQQPQHHHQQQVQTLHPDIIYEEMPTDYTGNMESGDEYILGGSGSGGGGGGGGVSSGSSDAAKRPKYLSEAL